MTKIIINGREVQADPQKPLIHACHSSGFDVPMYCYHPGLSPVGSCRICQVEVKQGDLPPRVVVACRTPPVEGMAVNTDSAKAHEVRRQCLEFLLKNHPLDCPICDKAGECDLQDYAFNEGQAASRTQDSRRKQDKRKSLGDVILLDEERCILCSRCVRFMEEVPKTPQLTVAGLGSRSVISTFMDRPLEGNYQGNLADVCPVGALTLKPFRFQARVWNLKKASSTCAECSRGCSVTVEVLRREDVKRFRPRYNPEVNRWWMCDTGRFAFGHVNAGGRLQGAVMRGYAGLESTSNAHGVELAADLLRAHERAVVVASPFLTIEEGEALLAVSRALHARATLLSPPPSGLADDVLNTGDPCPNRRGLSELGFDPLAREAALALIQSTPAALLVGERVAELVGDAALQGLGEDRRVIVLDTRAVDAAAVRLCIGVPNSVERSGTWINVDGHRGRIAAARPAPPDVPPLAHVLRDLLARLLEAPERVGAPMASKPDSSVVSESESRVASSVGAAAQPES